MYRPGSVGESAYGGAYGGYGDEFASAFAGLALGGEQAPGSPAFGAYAQPAQAAPPMSPRAAGQEAFNDASAHAESMFAEQDVHWLRAAYGQAFDPERLLAGEAVLADQGRAPSSPGYHSLYKTELCRSYEETSTCRYGNKCQFAHGQDELRPVMRHPRYKTELCRTFATSGTCPYGTRCRFIHYRGAAPVAAAPPGSGGAKLTVTVPPGSPRSPRVTPFIRGAGTPPASPGEIAGGAGPGSPPASPRQPPQMHSSLVPEGAPRHGGPGRSGNIANRVAPETPPCTPPRSGGSGASPRDNDSSGGNGNGSSNGSSGSEDSGGGLAKSRSRLPFFQTLCTAAGGKEAAAGAPAELAAAGAPTAPRSPKKGSPPPKMPPPAPNRAAMQRRGAVCD